MWNGRDLHKLEEVKDVCVAGERKGEGILEINACGEGSQVRLPSYMHVFNVNMSLLYVDDIL
jgi:hypothetical protein